ncbi:hypothetical protein [Millisia brevis]|uniref:hypothetical protein n=1 Tax=Millisia brevis TaxID=264148 RepID=UPI0008301095|nr:hypothetical protein [Millisia brevis]
MTLAATEAALILAQNPNETGPEFGKASPFGLVVILCLLAATALLIRSMNSRLRKLPTTFDRDFPASDQAADEGTDRGGVDDQRGVARE